jgi:hypothetical protein
VRLDDTEEGEVDPWAFFSPSFSSSPFTPTRTGSASGIGDTVSKWQYLVQYVASQRAFMTTRGLGVSGIDATCVGVNGAYLSTFMTDNATSAWTTSSQTTSLNGQTYLHTIKSAQGTKRHMEKIWLVHNDPSTNRFIKGTIRWWFISTWAGSGAYSTFGGRSIVQLSAGGTNHFTMPIFAGPWDGFTDPVAT